MEKNGTAKFGDAELSIEIGKIGRQADGAAWVRYGDTVVLVTVVASSETREGLDFFPLTVDYLEKSYAGGRIPGGFFKREGRPTDKEVLTSRLIDRSIRPLFPKGFNYEVQVIANVLSVDQENSPDPLVIIGASAALEISDIPFLGPVAGVRVGRIDGKLICNPAMARLGKSDIDLIVSGTKNTVAMVEGSCKEISEAELLEAVFFGHKCIQEVLDLQLKLKEGLERNKREVLELEIAPILQERVISQAQEKLRRVIPIQEKVIRKKEREKVFDEIIEEFRDEADEVVVKEILENLERFLIRKMVLEEGKRIDGRGWKDIRPISCQVGILPRTHGSALFTRGETQALVATTLGTSSDEQKIEALGGYTYKTFMLHYNFPPFSVGEVKPLRAPGRRETGHGALAERALLPVIPEYEDFPYTIRVVSDILESNGSSSMATVCGGSLSLMDGGIPIKSAVAGIGMGLIKEGEKAVILSDILGDEDHLGDMDFKVAGTRRGITAFQLDVKIEGIPKELMEEALLQAKEGRLKILEIMDEEIDKPRPFLSEYAPKIITYFIKSEKIRDLIGPGGKNIRNIIEQTGVKMEVDDSGKVSIASSDAPSSEKALEMTRYLTQNEIQVDTIYLGKVKKIVDFGVFVEISPGIDGLVHISQLSNNKVIRIGNVLKDGDNIIEEGNDILVKVIGIDRDGKIKLSRKEVLNKRL